MNLPLERAIGIEELLLLLYYPEGGKYHEGAGTDTLFLITGRSREKGETYMIVVLLLS